MDGMEVTVKECLEDILRPISDELLVHASELRAQRLRLVEYASVMNSKPLIDALELKGEEKAYRTISLALHRVCDSLGGV